MKKIFKKILQILRGFVINPFWRSMQVIIIIVLSLAIGGILWYIYQTRIHQYLIPFLFSSGLLFLNLFLANFLWNREKLASLFLIYTGLFVQILMLIFIKFLIIVF